MKPGVVALKLAGCNKSEGTKNQLQSQRTVLLVTLFLISCFMACRQQSRLRIKRSQGWLRMMEMVVACMCT